MTHPYYDQTRPAVHQPRIPAELFKIMLAQRQRRPSSARVRRPGAGGFGAGKDGVGLAVFSG
ncbi:hypothetical protein [Streptomyces sp. NPDC002845]